MGAIGAVFQPELIKLMKAVLDDAAATLPASKRTSAMMAEMASQICLCRQGRARPVDAKNRCAVGRGRVFALFARHLAGTACGVRRASVRSGTLGMIDAADRAIAVLVAVRGNHELRPCHAGSRIGSNVTA